MNPYEDMQTFIRIVEAGSITKAAEQMDTVKSAVSRRLTELEKRLGVSLLTRTTRSQTLTESGLSYYQQSVRILEDLAEVESSIRSEHQALSGRIKIAAPLSFGLNHLNQALRTFNDIHPDVYFDIDFNDRKVDLVQEGFDLAIRIANLDDSTLMAKPLFKAQGILCASPSYLKKHGIPKTSEDLRQGHVRMHYTGGRNSWPLLTPSGNKTTVDIPTVVSANNGDFLCQAAIDGKGLLFTPDFICYKAIRQRQLIPLLREYWCDNNINGYAIYPQTRHLSQRVRVLINYLSQYFGDEPYWRIKNDN
ncbi:LysR family transcriptional regulator [Thalassotalea insulae]|uniref:LysR family transcriptional regulator n=1 Tax=Thalassotalea insulae TaxID=2056778 RepID=A0ABQ6GQU2_9GAMM|nr:LysR family transcriptional regulator [Thalassotalea insulae]GLX77999.1 LysR family transcriptional regulator [Thalassotalea insulae]